MASDQLFLMTTSETRRTSSSSSPEVQPDGFPCAFCLAKTYRQKCQETECVMAEARPPGSKRLWVILSVAIFILSGVPIWWKLTEVYRAPLPYSDIELLSEQAASQNLALPIHLQVVFHSRKYDTKWDSFLGSFSSNLELQAHGSKIDVRVTRDTDQGCSSNSNWKCGLDVNHDNVDGNLIDDVLKDHIPESDAAGFYTIVVFLDSFAGSSGATLGKYRHGWIIGKTMQNSQEILNLVREIASVLLKDDQVDLMPVAADATATLSFSLLNANPKDWIYEWEFNPLKERFLTPMINMLSPVVNLSVESQILYYTPSTGRSQWDPQLGAYIVEAKDTSFFINANEWHLDTSTAAVGRSKVLHFAVYVPAASECPLRFRLPSGQISSTNAFISPGWGGVVVMNPRNCSDLDKLDRVHLKTEDLRPTMSVIVAQLRTLFGLSPVSSSSAIRGISNAKTGFSEWEVDLLLRRRSIADVNATISTLASLSRLIRSLPNLVIQDEISAQVQISLRALKALLEHQATSYGSYSSMAREGRELSEAAFFHPSIMSLRHFPAEHWLAIYVPFFVPLVLPTLAGLYRETARYVRKKR